ncbi:MAG TPA: hypothetical protein VK040_10120 [Balneolaceae bacterium]|nr:hypothetical protein [Balneolaceae bacterium]
MVCLDSSWYGLQFFYELLEEYDRIVEYLGIPAVRVMETSEGSAYQVNRFRRQKQEEVVLYFLTIAFPMIDQE